MTLNGIISVALVLGACVLFHEAGHFILAKLAGMRVDEFAAGFGRRLFGFRIGETEYRVNLIPLGGYVKIAGMEPGDADVERGFYRFPRWRGAAVLVAGSIMNVVLASLAFTAIAWFSGLGVFPDRSVQVLVALPDGAAHEAGLQAGDQIVALDGVRRSTFVTDVAPGSIAAKAGVVRYTWMYRHGSDDLSVPGDLLEAMRAAATPTAEGADADAEAAAPPTLTVQAASFDDEGSLIENLDITLPVPADLPEEWTQKEAGRILEQVLGVTLAGLDHGAAASYIASHPKEQIKVSVVRDSQLMDFEVTPRSEWARVMITDERGRLASNFQQVGKIGVVIGGKKQRAGFFRGIMYGFDQSKAAVVMVTKGLGMMLLGKIAPEASGPVGIAAMTADRAAMGWAAVVSLGGIISANLAVINLFPFPPFDGFRLVLLGVEGIIKRRVNAKVELYMTISGVAIILGLFLIITFKDIFNLVLYNTP